MQRLDISTRERISTQGSPMDLDAGRLALGEVVKLSAFVAGAWLVVMLGLLLVATVWGGDEYEWRAVTIIRYFFGGLGGGLAGLAAWLGATAGHAFAVEWARYRERRDSWHMAQLEAYERAGGQTVDRTLSIKALSVAEPAHLVLVGLALAEKVLNGQVEGPSAAALAGPIWCGRVQVGELTKPQSEEFAKALAQVGLITARRKGSGGRLSVESVGEAYQLLTTQAGRARQLVERAEEGE